MAHKRNDIIQKIKGSLDDETKARLLTYLQEGEYDFFASKLFGDGMLEDKEEDIQDPFFKACEQGNTDEVKRMVKEERIKVCQFSIDGFAPIHLAVESGNPETVRALVELGAEVYAMDPSGMSVLHYAARKGHVEVIRFLVNELQVLVDIRDDSGGTPLLRACLGGHLAAVKALVEAGADLNACSGAGDTPVSISARGNHPEVLRALLGFGANASLPTSQGIYPTQYAVSNGRIEILEILLSGGADPNLRDQGGKNFTLLQAAAVKGDEAMVKLLVKKGANVNEKNGLDGSTALHFALEAQKIGVVQVLINELGAKCDVVDSDGYTPLLAAVHHNLEGPAEMIIRTGVNVNALDLTGRTALHLAGVYGPIEIMPLLVQCGADVKLKDSKGSTALHAAVTDARMGAIRTLVKLGSDVNEVDKRGNTPLHLAPNAEVAGLLMELGANMSAVNKKGNTPLLQATLEGDKELVNALLESQAGKDVLELRNKKQQTALTAAMESGKLAIMEELVGAGAKLDVEDRDGNSIGEIYPRVATYLNTAGVSSRKRKYGIK